MADDCKFSVGTEHGNSDTIVGVRVRVVVEASSSPRAHVELER